MAELDDWITPKDEVDDWITPNEAVTAPSPQVGGGVSVSLSPDRLARKSLVPVPQPRPAEAPQAPAVDDWLAPREPVPFTAQSPSLVPPEATPPAPPPPPEAISPAPPPPAATPEPPTIAPSLGEYGLTAEDPQGLNLWKLPPGKWLTDLKDTVQFFGDVASGKKQLPNTFDPAADDPRAEEAISQAFGTAMMTMGNAAKFRAPKGFDPQRVPVDEFLRKAGTEPADSAFVRDFQGDVLRRFGYDAAAVEKMTDAERQAAYKEVLSRSSWGRDAQRQGENPAAAPGNQRALPAPEREAPPEPAAEQPPVDRSPENSAPVAEAPAQPPVDAEAAVLRAYGYSDDQIAAMSPRQRAAEYKDAVDAGVTAEQPTTTSAPSNEGAKVIEQPDSSQIAADDWITPGTRDAPVTAETPADLETAAAPVNTTPTEGQKEAGNYKKGHLRIAGLDVTIENPQGSTRSGVGPDGAPWSVEMPNHYGYVKRSRGKDGDQVDVYVGPEVKSPRAFVVDQINPATGRFDEHKVMLGFGNEDSALQAYDSAFSDGSGPERRQSVSAISVAELKDWLKNGDTNKPFAAPAKAVTKRVSQKAPQSLLQFIAGRGGIRPDDPLIADVRQIIGGKNKLVPGYGPLIRKDGKFLDNHREAAVEAAYMRDTPASGGLARTTVADLLERMDEEARGRKQYTEGHELTQQDQKTKARFEEGEERLAETRDHVTSEIARHEITDAKPEDVDRAARYVLNDGMDPVDAYDRAVMDAIRTEELLTDEQQDTIGIKDVFDALASAEAESGRPGAVDQRQEGAGRDKGESHALRRPDGEAGERADQQNEQRPADQGNERAAPVAEDKGRVEGLTFTTAKGSTYVVHDDGTTSRDKSYHPEHGIKDQGAQPRSQKTFYVTPEEAQALGEFQTQGGRKTVSPVGDGRWGVKYADGKDAGKFERRTVVTPKDAPAKGLIPVEIWKDGSRVHFGNAITSVGKAPAKADIPALREYARTVIGPEVRSVSLVGSQAAKGEGNDVDLLYDLGDRTLPTDADEAIEEIEDVILPRTKIDVHGYDTFLKVGDRYFAIQHGAGPALIENTDYAKDQAGKPSIELARAPATERTPAGEQAVLPGAGKITEGEQAQRKADQPLKPKVNQKPADEGLFGDSAAQTDLVDLANKPPVPKEDIPAGTPPEGFKVRARKQTNGGQTFSLYQQGKGYVGTFPTEAEAIAAANSTKDKPEKPPAEARRAGSTKPEMIQDAGEKIGGARKDQWKERGLEFSDIETLSGSEQATLVKKENVWPKPDYAGMIEGGAEPKAAYLVKAIYDRMATGPKADTVEGRKNFIEMTRLVRELAESAKTVADAQGLSKAVFAKRNWSENFRDPATRDKVFSVYRTRQEPFRISYAELRKADQEIAKGWPGAEPWTRRYKLQEYGGKWTVRQAGNYKVLADGLESKEAAIAKARELYEAEKGKAKEQLPERPHLDTIERTGPDVRGGRDVTARDFVSDFGFRGVEFGNWAASDERQRLVNLAYDAIHDFASVLHIPPKALSLDGTLGIAFGARGSGRFAAHYEPGKLVINLTKLRGAGTLAHEWGHAFDHYIGEQSRPDAYKGRGRYASGENKLDNIRPELKDAFKGVMHALFERRMTQAEEVRERELALEKNQAQITRVEKQLAALQERQTGGEKGLAKYIRQNEDFLGYARRATPRLEKELAEARQEGYEPTKTVRSSFLAEATKLNGPSGDYWTRPTEMLARSFEAYVFDKIAEAGNKSQYLVQGVEPDRYATGYKGNPYPDGVERAAINAAYDKLVSTLKLREGKLGPETALYSVAKPDMQRVGELTPAAKQRQADLEHMLTTLIQRLVGRDVRVQFSPGNTIDYKGEKSGWGAYGSGKGVQGSYTPAERLIKLALGGHGVTTTAFHEALHDIEAHLWSQRELDLMIRETGRLRDIVQKRYGFSDKEIAGIVGYEVRAMAFEAYAEERERGGSGFGYGLHIGIRRAFERLLKLLRAIKNGLSRMGFQTAEDIFGKAYEGKFADRPSRHEAPLSREDQAASVARPPPQRAEPKGTLRSLAERAGDLFDDARMKVAPMAVGSTESISAAKDFANAVRDARYRWSRRDELLQKNFTPEQRKRMWEAADRESVARQLGQEANPETGLASLTEAERAVVVSAQGEANRTWKEAQHVGIVEDDGLPSYVPRMVVMMNEAGHFEAPPSEGYTGNAEGIGKGFRTSTGQTKNRKYMTADETEAAMKARFGESAQIAKDIRALILATSKLQEAVAARALINKIKSVGNIAGSKTVSEGTEPADGQSWFTLDHPAFKTYLPVLEKNAETGKFEHKHYDDGTPAFERVPIYIRSDFKGPLQAVMGKDTGKIYNAVMALKGKAMSVIMYSPVIHNMVEYSRALPAYPLKVASTWIYWQGNRAKNDIGTMHEAILSGLVPIGKRFFNQDITSIMEEPNIAPGRSWTAQVLGFVPGLFDPKAGASVKRAVDKAGNFWHNTLLWDRVADLQMGLYVNMRDDLVRKGHDAQTASRVAAHFANRYAGALPLEAMSVGARKFANLLLFSRTFTLGNLGAMKDMVTGLPRDVQAQILRDAGPGAMGKAKVFAQRKARSIVMLDIALGIITTSILADVLKKLMSDRDWLGEGGLFADYGKRFAKMLEDVGKDPISAGLHPLDTIWKLSSTATNEPGKQSGDKARVLLYRDRTGRGVYGRNPLGKIGEEFVGWPTAPGDMLMRKLGTFARPAVQSVLNDRYAGAGFDRPTKIWRPDPQGWEWFKNAGRIALHFVEAQVPTDAIHSAYDLASEGKKDPRTDTLKMVAPFAGISISQGHPKGYMGAVKEQQRQKKSLDKTFGR